MKKILFITAFTPSDIAAAEKNTKIMLNDLGKSFSVDLVYFAYSTDVEYTPAHNVNVLRKIPYSLSIKIKNMVQCPFYHPFFTVRYDRSLLRELQTAINENSYDAIVFDHSLTFLYANKLCFNGPKLMISHDVMAQRAERGSNALMAKLCLWSEGKMLKADNAHLFAFCQKDVDLIKKYYHKDAHVILDYIDEKIINTTPEKVNDSFVMLANWKRPDNADGAVWLINELDGYLDSKISIDIVGKNFPEDRIKGNLKNIKLRILGFVDDPYKLIAESRAMLSPLLTGAGIKVKVMESLACGTPVIGTDISFEGFSDRYKSFMIQANTQQQFAACIDKLNTSLPERLSFRDMFIHDYQAESIPNWIKTLTEQ